MCRLLIDRYYIFKVKICMSSAVILLIVGEMSPSIFVCKLVIRLIVNMKKDEITYRIRRQDNMYKMRTYAIISFL